MNKALINPYVFSSLTRISDLEEKPFQVKTLDQKEWQDGDYVMVEVVGNVGGPLMVELSNGRMIPSMRGDLIIGALGTRHATLEATGSWTVVTSDGIMHLLTGAGLLGKMTSKSHFLPDLIRVRYSGHLWRARKLTMADFVVDQPPALYRIPTILIVGTSMSAGKTVTGRIVTRILRNAGLNVAGVKLTGAGRYKDILALRDAGARDIFDFVDVGLGSTIGNPGIILPRLKQLLTKIQLAKPDVAVVEIGASPLEPYNGDLAIMAIQDQIKCCILCASDPYAVYGVMESFAIIPDLVSGPATNTLAGRELIKNLCQIPSLNLIDGTSGDELAALLSKKLERRISQ